MKESSHYCDLWTTRNDPMMNQSSKIEAYLWATLDIRSDLGLAKWGPLNFILECFRRKLPSVLVFCMDGWNL